MANVHLPPSVYHVLVQHLPRYVPHHQQLDLRAVSKDFKHSADRCLQSLILDLVDVDTSHSPEAIQLLQKLVSLIVTFPDVRQLSFAYAEPLHVNDPWNELQPVASAAAPLRLLQQVAAAACDMLRQLLDLQPQEAAVMDPHVWIDPFLLLAEHYQEQHEQMPGQQHTVAEQQQQEAIAVQPAGPTDSDHPDHLGEQQNSTAGTVVSPNISSSSHSIDSEVCQSQGPLLYASSNSPATCKFNRRQQGSNIWSKLTAVYDCPADPFVLAVLLAVAPNIQKITFRPQRCIYWEVATGKPPANKVTGSNNSSSNNTCSSSSGSSSSGSNNTCTSGNSSHSSSSSKKHGDDDASSDSTNPSAEATSVSNAAEQGANSSSISSISSNADSTSHPSDLWFELEGDELQEHIQKFSNTQSNNICNNSQQSLQEDWGSVYSPWCLLQCIQLLQHHAKQLETLDIGLESMLPAYEWDWKGPARKTLRGLQHLAQQTGCRCSGGGSCICGVGGKAAAAAVEAAVAAAVAVAKGEAGSHQLINSQQQEPQQLQQLQAGDLEVPTGPVQDQQQLELATAAAAGRSEQQQQQQQAGAAEAPVRPVQDLQQQHQEELMQQQEPPQQQQQQVASVPAALLTTTAAAAAAAAQVDTESDDPSTYYSVMDSDLDSETDESDSDEDESDAAAAAVAYDWYSQALGGALAGCKQLQQLTIRDTAGAGGALVMSALAGLSNLTRLHLSDLSSSSDHWSYLQDPRALPNLTRLKHLAFDTAWPLALIAGEFRLLSGLTSLSVGVTAVDQDDSTRSVAHYMALGPVASFMIMHHLPHLKTLHCTHPMSWSDIMTPLTAADNASGLTRLSLPAIIHVWPSEEAIEAELTAATAAAGQGAAAAATTGEGADNADQQQQQQDPDPEQQQQQQQALNVEAMQQHLQDLQLQDMQLFQQEQLLLDQEQQLLQQLAAINAGPAAAAAAAASFPPGGDGDDDDDDDGDDLAQDLPEQQSQQSGVQQIAAVEAEAAAPAAAAAGGGGGGESSFGTGSVLEHETDEGPEVQAAAADPAGSNSSRSSTDDSSTSNKCVGVTAAASAAAAASSAEVEHLGAWCTPLGIAATALHVMGDNKHAGLLLPPVAWLAALATAAAACCGSRHQQHQGCRPKAQHMSTPSPPAAAAAAAPVVVIKAPQRQLESNQQQQQQQQQLAAVQRAVRQLPQLAGLLRLEVSSIGCAMQVKLADIAPALTCLRIGYTGQHADRRRNMLQPHQPPHQLLAVIPSLQRQLALPYGDLSYFSDYVRGGNATPNSHTQLLSLAAAVIAATAATAAAPLAAARAAAGTVPAGYTPTAAAALYAPGPGICGSQPAMALIHEPMIASAVYRSHWGMLEGHTALVRLECSYVTLTAGFVSADLLDQGLPNLREIQIAMPQWVGEEKSGQPAALLTEDWMEIWQQQQQQCKLDCKQQEKQGQGSANAEHHPSSSSSSKECTSPSTISSSNKTPSTSSSDSLSTILNAVLQRQQPLALALWRVLLQKLQKLELCGPWPERHHVDDESADQNGVKWFVGHLAELMQVLREESCRCQTHHHHQQQQQQHGISLQQLVIRDAEGAPEHWDWLLLRGLDTPAAAAAAADSTSGSSGSVRRQQQKQQHKLRCRLDKPLLAMVPSVVLCGCGEVSETVIEKYVRAAAVAATPTLRPSLCRCAVKRKQQQQHHALTLAGCDGVADYDCVSIICELCDGGVDLVWMPKPYQT